MSATNQLDETEEVTATDQSSLNSEEAREEEYLEFLEKYGHIDFGLLKFLPKIDLQEEVKKQKSSRKRKTN